MRADKPVLVLQIQRGNAGTWEIIPEVRWRRANMCSVPSAGSKRARAGANRPGPNSSPRQTRGSGALPTSGVVRLFIGSTVEGLDIARAIQQELAFDCEARIWNQGIFRPSESTLAGLIRVAPTFDFAVFVFDPDDMVRSRGKQSPTPRDNLLLELGLMFGKIGPDRTYVLYDRTLRPKLPSDLEGYSAIQYTPPSDGNHQASLGAACHEIRQRIRAFGERNARAGRRSR